MHNRIIGQNTAQRIGHADAIAHRFAQWPDQGAVGGVVCHSAASL
jgi:hypothetical protein